MVADGEEGFVAAPAPVPTLQAALEDWAAIEPKLRAAHAKLVADRALGQPVDPRELASPLPRAYQWAEGSTYLAHMERLRAARGIPLPPAHGRSPAVYQSGSDSFLGPCDPIPLDDEDWGLDLEATVVVITDDVPIGTSIEDAASHVKLVALANDLTLRNVLTAEYEIGVGFYQSKPARPLAPLAVTPDALGDAWADGGLRATVDCRVNGERLGTVDSGRDCAFTFPELIAHMTRTRSLTAGTLVGSGTVSNRDAVNGFACLAEKRAEELVADGTATTPFLRAGDRVRVEALGADGRSLFGAIDQLVATPERRAHEHS